MFTPMSTMPDTSVDSIQNYKALLLGDVSSDWMPPTMMRPEAAIVPDTNTASRFGAEYKSCPRVSGDGPGQH